MPPFMSQASESVTALENDHGSSTGLVVTRNLVDRDGSRHSVALAWTEGAPLENALSASERQRAQSFANEKAKDAFIRGRRAAKSALHELAPGENFDIAKGAFQQPVVTPHRGLDVSLSHTGEVAAAIAFPSGWPCALDLEGIGAGNARTIRSQIDPAELDALTMAGVPEATALTVLWCCREALSKALRGGLAISFPMLTTRSVEVAQNRFACRFDHIAHFRAEAVWSDTLACAVVIPTYCTLDWSPLARWVQGARS